MQKTILFLLFVSLLCACNETKNTETSSAADAKVAVEKVVIPDHSYYASYVGSFEAEEINDSKNGTYSNLINITVTGLDNGKAEGRSIIAGNDRPFNGTYQQTGSRFDIIATEPGDDKHDGRFEFKLDTAKQTVSGKWYSNDKSIAVPVRKFELNKKTFVYNADNNFDEGIIGAALNDGDDSYESITDKVTKINASKQKLTNKNVENLYKGDLELIRNAIYARHGYSFRNRRMRYLFDNYVDWYIPMNIDVRSNLSELEKENIALLKRYEHHAEKYYDEYSR